MDFPHVPRISGSVNGGHSDLGEVCGHQVPLAAARQSGAQRRRQRTIPQSSPDGWDSNHQTCAGYVIVLPTKYGDFPWRFLTTIFLELKSCHFQKDECENV